LAPDTPGQQLRMSGLKSVAPDIAGKLPGGVSGGMKALGGVAGGAAPFIGPVLSGIGSIIGATNGGGSTGRGKQALKEQIRASKFARKRRQYAYDMKYSGAPLGSSYYPMGR